MSDKLVIAVIDRSGSMSSMQSDMNGGIRTWLSNAVAADPNAQLVSILFDDQIEVTNERTPLKDVDNKTLMIKPRGVTALNDAIMRGLSYIKKDEDALVLIVTDGGENASKEVKSDQVKKRIEELEKQGVEFVYLSASPTAFEDAASYGGTMSGSLRSFNAATTGSVLVPTMTESTVSYLSKVTNSTKKKEDTTWQ